MFVTKTRQVYSGVSNNWYCSGSSASRASGFFSYRSARKRYVLPYPSG
jgi:hypothetical protein